MRKKIVAGNWKMNNNLDESKALVKELKEALNDQDFENTRVIIAPPFVNLRASVKRTRKSVIEVAAQNMHQADGGAFTGEISAEMLKSIGVNIVILGHSERREYFGENAHLLTKKVEQALEHGIEVIFCFGEKLEDRNNNNHFNVVEYQLKDALFHLKEVDWQHVILAYEPVWAIGTGETASPEQAQEMHAFIRNLLAQKYDLSMANEVSILYGGSVKPDNAATIFSKNDVDGGLIGGASLNVDDFVQIINAI